MENTDYEVVENQTESVGFELSVKTMPEIVNNKEDFMKYLDVVLEKYREIVIADETQVAEGKKTVAQLRKAKETIDTRRKEVKKELLKPYEEVEDFCKDVSAKIDNVITPIVVQLDMFEADRIKRKNEECEAILADVLKGLDEKVAKFANSCEFIRNPKWQNTTKVRNEINQNVQKIVSDLEVLKSTLTDKNFTAIALDTYKRNGDVAETIRMYKSLVEKVESNKVAVDKAEIPQQLELPKADPEASKITDTDVEQPKVYKFTITATPKQFESVLAFLKANGIHGSVTR